MSLPQLLWENTVLNTEVSIGWKKRNAGIHIFVSNLAVSLIHYLQISVSVFVSGSYKVKQLKFVKLAAQLDQNILFRCSNITKQKHDTTNDPDRKIAYYNQLFWYSFGPFFLSIIFDQKYCLHKGKIKAIQYACIKNEFYRTLKICH